MSDRQNTINAFAPVTWAPGGISPGGPCREHLQRCPTLEGGLAIAGSWLSPWASD